MGESGTASIKGHICSTLEEEITSGAAAEGEQLPSVRKLADRFDTSIYTVQKALKNLEDQGYVRVEQGIGTFITDTTPNFRFSHAVALCLLPQVHLEGPLSALITRKLLRHGLSPLLVDTHREDARRMMRSMARSGVEVFALLGHEHCPFDVLEDSLFQDKWVLGLLEWFGPDRDRLLRVLSDDEAGGRMVARHLWEKGHRRAALVATHGGLESLRRQQSGRWQHLTLTRTQGFLEEWKMLGGTWRTLQSRVSEGTTWIEQEAFLDVFGGPDEIPTAVFGFRDVEAARVQQGLREWTSGLEGKVDIVGYYDTPWSRAAHPPLSTVSLRLEQIAEHTARLVESALTDDEVKNPVRVVQPELIVR